MADEEAPAPQSIAQRIAALKLKDGGAPPMPGGPPPSYQHATSAQNSSTTGSGSTPTANGSARPRPPPPPRPSLPSRPSAHGRTVSANVPTQNGTNGHANENGIGNMPEQGEEQATVSRPALPPRTSTQSVTSPALPPRRPSESPALSSRRASAAPSNYSLSRRESSESMSSLATTRSGTSAFSNGDRYSVKAPMYDPTSLPPLPPKRTQEEREADLRKYQNVGGKGRPGGGLRSQKSMPRMHAKQEGTTPPPPPAPARTGPSVPARPMARQAPSLPARSSTSDAGQAQSLNEAPPPQLPSRLGTAQAGPSKSPPLPSRASSAQVEQTRSPLPPASREMAAPPPRKSALTMGFGNKTTDATPSVPGRPIPVPQTDGAGPPPVPKGSRPDLAALQASKPKMNGSSTTASAPPAPQSSNSCLHCRDFSGPDNHAARFPRESIPSQDVGWLAHQLTAPFSSLTDKARAIFTWLHHNIAYDTVSFFSGNLKPSTPQSTLASGMAVCEGYAGLFAALAMKAGLEAYVVGGHSKGYGYTALEPGQPIPPFKSDHAWNAVRIDGGEWKLIDCCWGAGNVSGPNRSYVKQFTPERFTQSNDELGLDHYPEDRGKQFRTDGRVMPWEEYITGYKNGCGAYFFGGYAAEEGLSRISFQPHEDKISLSSVPGPTVRFLFQKICPHWDPVRNGKGPYYLYVLHLDGLEGTKRNGVPFQTTASGVWYCDVPVQDLGRPGGKAVVQVLTQFDGKEGRGLTIEKYLEKQGKCGWAAAYVCRWEIVA